MLDLNDSNVNEIEDGNIFDAADNSLYLKVNESCFRFGEPIFEYHSNEVGGKKLTFIHARGASRNELVDIG